MEDKLIKNWFGGNLVDPFPIRHSLYSVAKVQKKKKQLIF